MGLRFLYKLKSYSSYMETLNMLDNSEDQNYKKNERSTKPTGVYLRRLERRYMGEQMEIKEMNQTQQLPWLINNILICYEGNKHTGNESEKKQHFLQHKKKHSSTNNNVMLDCTFQDYKEE